MIDRHTKHWIPLFVLLFAFPLSLASQNSRKAEKAYDEAVKSYFTDKDSSKALLQIDKALQADPDFVEAWWLAGDIALSQRKYERAISAYEHVQMLDPNADVAPSLALALFRLEATQRPVPFEPVNLGKVNTSHDEYINMMLFDNSTLLLTRRTRSTEGMPQEESLFYALWKDEAWQEATAFTLPYLQSHGIGAACCSPDGTTLFFSYHDGEKHSSRDIFTTRLVDGIWSRPESLTGINTGAWESQPCLSADGKELFFTRRIKGHAKIFSCKRASTNDAWSPPIKLDTLINVAGGNQMAPFLHPDGKTLYFASDKHVGMGGFDIFMSRRMEDGTWGEPINLGYPINTDHDEINFYVAPDGKTAFISSQREGGYGGYDIYSFTLEESLRPDAVTYFDGEVVILDVYPQEINKGDTLTIRNIQFEYNSAKLTDDSKDGIAKIAELMAAHPYWHVELAGHTDDIGSDAYNQKLSTDRAEAVRKALIALGIDPKRMQAIGHGSTLPVAPNDTEENKAKNRRTELIILNE